jgi:hypothetical protein
MMAAHWPRSNLLLTRSSVVIPWSVNLYEAPKNDLTTLHTLTSRFSYAWVRRGQLSRHIVAELLRFLLREDLSDLLVKYELSVCCAVKYHRFNTPEAIVKI